MARTPSRLRCRADRHLPESARRAAQDPAELLRSRPDRRAGYAEVPRFPPELASPAIVSGKLEARLFGLPAREQCDRHLVSVIGPEGGYLFGPTNDRVPTDRGDAG